MAATQKIEEILSRNKIPIIVGGTGLYVDALVYNIEYLELETDLKYRQELENLIEQKGLEELYEKAKQIDEQAMQSISKK